MKPSEQQRRTPLDNVLLIAAIGKRGQLGFKNDLPWGNTDKEDLAWFKATTDGHVIVVGPKTFAGLPRLPNRIVKIYDFKTDPTEFLLKLRTEYPDKLIFIAGGAATYKAFQGLYRRSLITHVNYDGLADTFLDSLWSTPSRWQKVSKKNAKLSTSDSGFRRTTRLPSYQRVGEKLS